VIITIIGYIISITIDGDGNHDGDGGGDDDNMMII
jgi:hypothetical protein